MSTINTLLTRGYAVRLNQAHNGEWCWELKLFRRKVASGAAATEKGARADLARVIGDKMVAEAVSRTRASALKLKLRGWVERRPYIAHYVLAACLDGLGKRAILQSVAQEEKIGWTHDTERCGWAHPLPTSPLAKPPEEVGAVICDLIVQLGWKKPQVKRFAVTMFGSTFPESQSLDMIEAAADRAVEEDSQ